MSLSEAEALPHLSEEAQRRHATMVLGGWRFEQLSYGPYWVNGPYWVTNPQGHTVAARYTLLTAVDDVWFLYGGNGK